MNVGKILTFIDLNSESRRSLERTAWLAEKFAADVEIFACKYDQYLVADEAKSNVVNADRETIEKLARPIESAAKSVSVDVEWAKSVDDAILEKIEKSRPDLVVKDTHYHSLLRRTLLSNTDWTLIGKCPVPLLLVKDRDVPANPAVVAAVDPTHQHDKPAALDRRILTFAKYFADRTNGHTHAVHVVDTAGVLIASSTLAAPAAGPAPTVDSSMIKELVSSARKSFLRLLSEESIDEESGRVLEGEVATQLARTADELNADFVLMGAVARGFLENAFVGHTAQRVLDRLGCDLIVVK
ncbi:MAG TPA: universal stress protein [Gammaproteobacteria bacterium]|nr:universal stress protein [Gammaproteobacteria bacterium]